MFLMEEQKTAYLEEQLQDAAVGNICLICCCKQIALFD